MSLLKHKYSQIYPFNNSLHLHIGYLLHDTLYAHSQTIKKSHWPKEFYCTYVFLSSIIKQMIWFFTPGFEEELSFNHRLSRKRLNSDVRFRSYYLLVEPVYVWCLQTLFSQSLVLLPLILEFIVTQNCQFSSYQYIRLVLRLECVVCIYTQANQKEWHKRFVCILTHTRV